MQKLRLNLLNLEKVKKIRDKILRKIERKKIDEWRNTVWKQAS